MSTREAIITDEMINAAAREMWNDRDARHGGSWDDRDPREVCVIQTKATARAALIAALAAGGEIADKIEDMLCEGSCKHLEICNGTEVTWCGQRAQQILALVSAAAPASPLRGRETERCPTCRHTDEEYTAGDWTCADPWHADDHLRAKSASPPEQPAEVPDQFRRHAQCAPSRTIHRVEHDGFEGVEIGSYTTLEGKQGVVLQQVGTRVVHVYGKKWLTAVTSTERG